MAKENQTARERIASRVLAEIEKAKRKGLSQLNCKTYVRLTIDGNLLVNSVCESIRAKGYTNCKAYAGLHCYNILVVLTDVKPVKAKGTDAKIPPKRPRKVIDRETRIAKDVAAFCISRNTGYFAFDRLRGEVSKWLKTNREADTQYERVLKRMHSKMDTSHAKWLLAKTTRDCVALLRKRGVTTPTEWNAIRRKVEKFLYEEKKEEFARYDALERVACERRRAMRGEDD